MRSIVNNSSVDSALLQKDDAQKSFTQQTDSNLIACLK